MGEESWRITVTGEPGLDALSGFPSVSKAELYANLGLDPTKPVTVFTYHPETAGSTDQSWAISTILQAARKITSQIVFTYPGMDSGADEIIKALDAYAVANPLCRVFPHLGRERFFNLLSHADCMIGNSSSGIVEAASFSLPAVNIGIRQKGRLAPANVIAVPIETDAIGDAWQPALSGEFRRKITGLANPYGDGQASGRIVARLAAIPITADLIHKRGCTMKTPA